MPQLFLRFELSTLKAEIPNIGVLHFNTCLVPGFLLEQLIPKKSIHFSVVYSKLEDLLGGGRQH